MATPQRLPIVNSDDGTWGDIIRQYLMKEHYNDDTNNPVNGGHQTITVRAGTATAGTAPLKFTSGTLLTTPEVGTVEFNTDTLYFTITSSALRKKFAIYDDSSGATGDTYYRDSSGNFTRLGIGSSGQALKVASGLPAWGNAMGFAWATKTSNYTVSSSDTAILADATSGSLTITLPAASGVSGYRFYIKRLDSSTTNKVTIACSSGDTIDGMSSMFLIRQYDMAEVVSNGSSWYLLNYTTYATQASGTVGTSTFRSAASTGIVTGSTNTTCNIPPGTVSGDVMIALYDAYDAASITMTPPSGWTAIGSQATSTASGDLIISQAYYKVAGGSEPSSYTFSISATQDTDLAIVTYYGVNTTSPIDTSSANGGISTTRTGTGVTTTSANDKLLFMSGGYNGNVTAGPSGMTQRVNWDTTCYIYDKDIPATGATGNFTATQASDNWTVKMIALKSAAPASITDPSPIGTISMFPSTVTPPNWAICDGSAVSRTTYPTLFSAIGTAYGSGDGSTTFNLPNFKGNAPVGYDTSQTEFNTMGKTGGEKTHVLTTPELPSHTHTQNAHTHALANSGNSLADSGTGSTYNVANGSFFNFHANTIANTTATNQNTGGDGAHNNLQPYITLNFIIKMM